MALRASTARRRVRHARDGVLDWVDRHDSTELFFMALGVVIFVAAPLIAVFAISRGPPAVDPLEISPPVGPVQESRVDFTNREGGYGFTYPSTWELRETGPLTRLESPSGRVVLTFGIGTSSGLATASSRLVTSLAPGSDPELIGTRFDEIGGSRSLLTSGLGEDEMGRRVRFLAIVIRGQPVNYEISIVVPAESDPNRVLPRLEEIVASFDLPSNSLV